MAESRKNTGTNRKKAGSKLDPSQPENIQFKLINLINKINFELKKSETPAIQRASQDSQDNARQSLQTDVINAYLELGTLLEELDRNGLTSVAKNLPDTILSMIKPDELPPLRITASMQRTIQNNHSEADFTNTFHDQINRINYAVAFHQEIHGHENFAPKLDATLKSAKDITPIIRSTFEENLINPEILNINRALSEQNMNDFIYHLYRLGAMLNQCRLAAAKKQPPHAVDMALSDGGINLLSQLVQITKDDKNFSSKRKADLTIIQNALNHYLATTDQEKILASPVFAQHQDTDEALADVDLLSKQIKVIDELKKTWSQYAENLAADIKKFAEKLPIAVFNHYVKSNIKPQFVGQITQRLTGDLDIEYLVSNAIHAKNVAYVYGDPQKNVNKYSSDNIRYTNHTRDCSPINNPALYASIIKYNTVQKFLSILHDESLSFTERLEQIRDLENDKDIRELISFHRDSPDVTFNSEFLIHQEDSLSGYGLPSNLMSKHSFFKSTGDKLLASSEEKITEALPKSRI